MKKILLGLSLVGLSISAARIAQQPKFDNNSIMMSANGGLCGGFTLTPLPDMQVRVMSQRFAETLLGSEMKAGKQLSNWVDLPAKGLRIGYDWAGSRPSYHYRIFCQLKNEEGQWVATDCQKVVTIKEVLHNRPCVWGAAGARALYEPLNMRVKGIR